MLNYVWIGLLVLGMAAAVSTDLSRNIDNTYRNGKFLEVSVQSNEQLGTETGRKKDITILISPKTYNALYEEPIDSAFSFPARVTLKEDQETFNLYFNTNDNMPPLWIEMAGVSGEEDDMGGILQITDKNGDGTYQAKIMLEEVGYVKLKSVTDAALSYAEVAVEIALGLIGIMAMWLGIMKIAEEAGIIRYIAVALRPVTRFLFPDVPHDHPAIGSMIMNISATFLGLGNAATPFGIKAMEDLNKLNPNKGVATNAMCTFLVINTASFALMPATAIAVRAAAGSTQPAIIIGTTMFGSFTATVVGITAAKILEKFPLKFTTVKEWITNNLRKFFYVFALIAVVFLLYVTGMFAEIGSLLSFLNPDLLRNFIQIISIIAIPFIILSFVLFGVFKKVKIYETFVEGAKEGFKVAVTIIPYLVAILVAIGIFRAGGAMDWLIYILSPITDFVGMPTEALPMMMMRPLSGSGSLGIMAEIISVHGADSFIGVLVSTVYGSTETTFFVLAVYFGAVNIKKTRHALPAGLIADIAGMLAALFIVKLLFG